VGRRPWREGQSRADAAANPMLNMEVVAPAYFAAFELPARRGRTFTADDRAGAPPVVLLSEAAARAYFPDGDAVGRRLFLVGDRPATVVGVVPDTRYRELREARATIYFPLAQSPFPFAPTTLAIRTDGPPGPLVAALARAVADAAPGVELASAAPFERYLAAPLAQPRLNALLLAVFAAAAVLLAAVGLFGVHGHGGAAARAGAGGAAGARRDAARRGAAGAGARARRQRRGRGRGRGRRARGEPAARGPALRREPDRRRDARGGRARRCSSWARSRACCRPGPGRASTRSARSAPRGEPAAAGGRAPRRRRGSGVAGAGA
jgi:hypothetical protein